ncbi:MAG: hypothetical protein F6K11_33990 [Leptolyngbya sp. SIO3F4]|nr:hypothetical protein [Leptolyngbya sp. SIO3F4]
MSWESTAVQDPLDHVYTKVCVPTPATEGEKVLAVTPGPLYVPPGGVAAANGNATPFTH